jgi:hypothetical protein
MRKTKSKKANNAFALYKTPIKPLVWVVGDDGLEPPTYAL